METYAIFTTFILGLLFGFFGLAGVLMLLIRRDDKKKQAEKDFQQAAEAYAKRFGGTVEEAKTQIYIDKM